MKENERNNISVFFTIAGIFLLLTTFGVAGGLSEMGVAIGKFNTDLLFVAAAIVVTAIIWAGFKVMFGAGWADVSNVVWGAFIVGAAVAIGGLLIPGGGSA